MFSMLQRVANDDMMLNELNHECKRVKSMLKLKEAFKNEVGEHTWEEAAQKYPDFATESRLVRFSGKLEGPRVSLPVLPVRVNKEQTSRICDRG